MPDGGSQARHTARRSRSPSRRLSHHRPRRLIRQNYGRSQGVRTRGQPQGVRSRGQPQSSRQPQSRTAASPSRNNASDHCHWDDGSSRRPAASNNAFSASDRSPRDSSPAGSIGRQSSCGSESEYSDHCHEHHPHQRNARWQTCRPIMRKLQFHDQLADARCWQT